MIGSLSLNRKRNGKKRQLNWGERKKLGIK
jgi:hypothetical protein